MPLVTAGREANTSADESPDWHLASAELAFVTEHVRCSEARAEELLRDGLAKECIRWDCDPDLTVRGDFQAYPSLRTTFATARGHAFFWRRYGHSHVDMNWPTSGAAWAGPLTGFSFDGRGNSWPIFDDPPRASTSLIASAVRFHHGDIVSWLAELGLMPQPSTEAESAEAELAEAGPRQRPAHRAEREIPRWSEAMAYLKSCRTDNPAIIKTKEERAAVIQWYSDHSIKIVEPTDENMRKAKSDSNLIPLSDRQLARRIKASFKQPE